MKPTRFMKRIIHAGGMALMVVMTGALGTAANTDLGFRTDINPALLYFQAYQYMPQLSEADRKQLFENTTMAAGPKSFDEHERELLKQYDYSFKGLHRARFAKVPCDWGYDLSDGPEALLPGLAPAKGLAQAARLRAMVALDANNFEAALDDLQGALVLGRNLSRDHILISALVQIAMENILGSVVMENYYRLSAEELDEIVTAFDSAPPRGRIADTVTTENNAFYRYILGKVERMIADSEGDTEGFWQKFEAFWNPIATDVESNKGPEPSAAEVRQAAQGRTDELLKLVNEMPGWYEETTRMMNLPYAEYKAQGPAFFNRVTESPNPFIRQFFRVFRNVRPKEFSVIVRMEMLRAAAAYKRGGMGALGAIQDPLVGGPFEFGRAKFEGQDRGIQLKSKEQFRDFDEVMIFLEKPGKHFWLDGKNAGTAR
jgi:hypothetical protein